MGPWRAASARGEPGPSGLPCGGACEESRDALERAVLEVGVVETLDDVRALAPAWRALASARHAFVGPEWTETWLEGPGADARPFLLVARGLGGIEGVLPLARRDDTVSTCGAPEGLSRVDVVARPSRSAAVAHACADALLARSDLRLRLDRLDAEGDLARALRERLGGALRERFAVACPYLRHDGDWPSFLRRLSKKERHEEARQTRRFFDEPRAEVRWVRDADDVDAGLDAFFRLHALRSAALGRSSSLAHEGVETFHRRLARRLAARGDLLLGLLLDEGRAVAAAYGFHAGDTTSFFNAGVDPSFRRAGAGVVLRSLVWKDEVLGAGRRELDLLAGCQGWKLRWATGLRRLVDVHVPPGGAARRAASSRALAVAHAFRRGLARALCPGSEVRCGWDAAPGDAVHCLRLRCPYAPSEA